MTALTWTMGSWLVRVHQSGGSQSVTFDVQATISDRVYSIKQQGRSWVVIRLVNEVDDRYHVFDSVDAAKRQAEEWEQAVRSEMALGDAAAAPPGQAHGDRRAVNPVTDANRRPRRAPA